MQADGLPAVPTPLPAAPGILGTPPELAAPPELSAPPELMAPAALTVLPAVDASPVRVGSGVAFPGSVEPLQAHTLTGTKSATERRANFRIVTELCHDGQHRSRSAPFP